jgi:hypothetical protein
MINFQTVKNYLDAIANNANKPIGGSPHGAFWQVDYPSFTTGTVKTNRGTNPPIMDTKNPLQSPFFLVLINKLPGFPQMPFGGPFITDPGYTVKLADGTQITGAQIIANLQDWLGHGFPQ